MYLNRDIGYIFFRVAGSVRGMAFPISSAIYFPEYWQTEWRNEQGILMVRGRYGGLSSSILIAILSYYVTVFHVAMDNSIVLDKIFWLRRVSFNSWKMVSSYVIPNKYV